MSVMEGRRGYDEGGKEEGDGGRCVGNRGDVQQGGRDEEKWIRGSGDTVAERWCRRK